MRATFSNTTAVPVLALLLSGCTEQPGVTGQGAHRAPALGRRDVEVRDVHRPLQLEDASVAAKHRGDVRAQAVDRSTGLPFGLSNAPPSVRRCRLNGAAIARAALTCLLACTHDQGREG